MRKVISIILVAMLLAAMALTASAESTTDLTVRLVDESVPVVGASFDVYLVGERNNQSELVLTGDFAAYPVDLGNVGENTREEATALYGFAKRDGLEPNVVVTIGADGSATATGLEAGIYLIAGAPYEYQGVIYHTEPMLLVLPYMDVVTGQYDYAPVMNVKFTEETKETVDLKVLKIWNDHSGQFRPKAITVHLLKDGVVYDTVTLTAATQWRHVWTELDGTALWQIVEDVPWYYTVRIERVGNTFLLKNFAPEAPKPEDPTVPGQPTVPTQPTAPTEPGTPTQPNQPTQPTKPSDKIPQTGMLWWPVLVLVNLGIALVAGGVILRRGSKDET